MVLNIPSYDVNILQEVFDQFNVLESIHLIYCSSLNSDFVQQIIEGNKPFKLGSLFMDEILHVSHVGSLELLLEKVGDCLENFGFGFMKDEYNESKRQLFKLIMKKYEQNINFHTTNYNEYTAAVRE
ncbi:hypothetical protein C1646_755388 [Rhizophagus diaphanus]|nr:hypothetical protein C1646_755388 [Rhizophagus diaphanus] [Rhizophagus sp. MUCL 43196]